jgi:hypothetical protein
MARSAIPRAGPSAPGGTRRLGANLPHPGARRTSGRMFALHHVLSYAGLAAAVVLFVAGPSRVLAVIAVLAAALEVAIRLDVLHVSIPHVPLGMVLGFCLAVPGLIAWFRSTAKAGVTAAAIATFVGLAQLAAYLPARL